MTFARIHQYLSMATPLLWMRQADTIGVLGLALNACDERERPPRGDRADPRAARAPRASSGGLARDRGRARADRRSAHGVPARPPRRHPGGDDACLSLSVNGAGPRRRRAGRASLAEDAARRPRPDRDEDRLRRGALRRVHRPARRRARALVHHARAHGRRARGDDDRGPARAPARRGVRPRRRAPVRLLHARPDRLGRGARRGAPEPTTEEIRHAMAGNLCRCGAYPRIEEAIRTWRD